MVLFSFWDLNQGIVIISGYFSKFSCKFCVSSLCKASKNSLSIIGVPFFVNARNKFFITCTGFIKFTILETVFNEVDKHWWTESCYFYFTQN